MVTANEQNERLIDQIAPTRGTPVYFSHQLINGGKPLHIYGVNNILWQYELITTTTSTYGGEVTQILGARTGPMQIDGEARSYAELEKIRRWFVEYMTLAGQQRRTEIPVLFKYPERGWAFEIMPTGFGPWELNNELVAQPWAMSAEIVSSNKANGLVEHTMNAFVKPLTSATFTHIAFSPINTRTQFTDQELFARLEEHGSTIDKLLATAASGDFSIFGLGNISGDKSADEIYEDGVFGSKWLIEPEGESGSSGTTGSGPIPTTRLEVVTAIKNAFEAQDMPGRLGVAVALQEANLNPDARQDNGDYAMGLFQTFPNGAGGSAPNANSLRRAFKQSGEDDVTTYKGGYSATQQIADAVTWFKSAAPDNFDPRDNTAMAAWAQRAQRAGVAYDQGSGKTKFFGQLKEADRLIKEAAKAMVTGANGEAKISSITLTGSALSNAVLHHARFNGTDGNAAIGDITNYLEYGINEKVLKGLLCIMNAGWNIHLSVLKTGHSVYTSSGNRSDHSIGLAADLNNYGPGGAGSTGPGTSSTNPAQFVTFLKANRKGLGIRQIGGGATAEQARMWGTDFADSDTHIHLGWQA